MKVDFWFDPICPWCWVTSRWLTNSISKARDLEINWRPISLLYKNEMGPDHPYFNPATKTRNLLRVFLSIKEQHGNEVAGNFYTAAGEAIHNSGNSEIEVVELLESLGLDPALGEAYDDSGFDEKIKSEMKDGLDLVGDDVGTPIIAFTDDSGIRRGIFGPVISKVPADPAKSLELWDSIITISSMDEFWELKRTRTVDPDFNY